MAVPCLGVLLLYFLVHSGEYQLVGLSECLYLSFLGHVVPLPLCHRKSGPQFVHSLDEMGPEPWALPTEGNPLKEAIYGKIQ